MKFLRIQKLCFNSFGFSFNPNESILIRFFALLNWALLLGISIPEAHFAVENSSSVELVTDTLATLLTCILTLTKVMRMFFNSSKLYEIVLELEVMWLKASNEDKPLMEKALNIERRITWVYLLSGFGAGVSYMAGPILKAIYDIQTTGNATWTMPMRAVFIYDTTVTPNYELTYLWFAHGTFLAVAGSVGVDCMFYGWAFNISSHFQVIQKRFRNIKFDAIKSSPGKNRNDFMQTIRYHDKMLTLCNKCSDLYAPILFIQFMITALLICVIAYQLTLPGQLPITIATKVFFLATIWFQCFTYCDAGSQLTSQTFEVSNAIYGSNWYEGPVEVKKLIQFVLMRAQKSFVVYSGFYEANLNTFSSIISAAGSYIALLQSLQDG